MAGSHLANTLLDRVHEQKHSNETLGKSASKLQFFVCACVCVCACVRVGISPQWIKKHFSNSQQFHDSTQKVAGTEPKWVYVSFFTECSKISQNLMVDHILPMKILEEQPHLQSQIQRIFSKWTRSSTSNSWTRFCSCFTSYGRGSWYFSWSPSWRGSMNLCKICRKNKTASGYVCFIIGVIGDCPETSGIR